MKKEIMIESLNGVTNEVKKLITKMDRFWTLIFRHFKTNVFWKIND